MRELEPVPEVDELLLAEGETFTVRREDGDDVELELLTVDRPQNAGTEWERFTLRFGPVDGDHIEQDLYRITHPRLSGFDVTLSPTPTTDPDPQTVVYEGIINRNRQESENASGRGPGISRRGILGSLLGVAAGWSLLGDLFGGGSSGPVGVASAAGSSPYLGTIGLFGLPC